MLTYGLILYKVHDILPQHEHSYLIQDLAQYQYDKMVAKSVALLTKYYSAKADLFDKAVQAQVSTPGPRLTQELFEQHPSNF